MNNDELQVQVMYVIFFTVKNREHLTGTKIIEMIPAIETNTIFSHKGDQQDKIYKDSNITEIVNRILSLINSLEGQFLSHFFRLLSL